MTETVGVPAALLAGILSFLSPCILPLVPAYLSYISGVSVEEMMSDSGSPLSRRTGIRSLIFVAGFSLIFILLGAGATWIGQVLTSRLDIISKIAGAVVIILGFHMMGIIRIKALFTEKRFNMMPRNAGMAEAFLFGIVFAFAWTPCIGPILAAILALAAESKTMLKGIVLLTAYSIGLGVPFILAGFATGTIISHISKVKKHFHIIEIISGGLLIVIGITILTGSFQWLSEKAMSWSY